MSVGKPKYRIERIQRKLQYYLTDAHSSLDYTFHSQMKIEQRTTETICTSHHITLHITSRITSHPHHITHHITWSRIMESALVSKNQYKNLW